MSADAPHLDPLHQFEVKNLITFGFINDSPVAFTNVAFCKLIILGIIVSFLFYATRKRSLIPSRAQSIVEILYAFIANTLRESAGPKGMKFFPFVFSLFIFITVANLAGMFPYFYTVTSQVIVTSALSLLVIGTVIFHGFSRHGLGFLKLFVPSGVHWSIAAFIIPIEVISFLSRPVSLSVRLFANMLAGHILLKVFAGFVVSLLATGYFIVSVLPMGMVVALTGLEFLVAVLQAYVFTILTCMYIGDAIEAGH